MAVLELCTEILFVQQILEFLGEKVDYSIIMNMDNQGTVFLAHNDGASMRMRHIDVRYHFVICGEWGGENPVCEIGR